MWRKIQKKDVSEGTVIRFTAIEDGYNLATIVGIFGEDVWISRPYAYASADYASRSGLVGTENFPISITSMCKADIEVYEGKKEVRKMLVRAA